jgi:hypothetical protein
MPTYRMFLSTENIMSAICSGSIACAKPQETSHVLSGQQFVTCLSRIK